MENRFIRLSCQENNFKIQGKNRQKVWVVGSRKSHEVLIPLSDEAYVLSSHGETTIFFFQFINLENSDSLTRIL